MPSVEEAAKAAAEYYAEQEARKNKPGKDAKARFRSSLQWRRCRYAVLAANAARQPDHKPRCELCGRGVDDGVVLSVDHLIAISTPEGWRRRFDTSVQRVCCMDCNAGRLATPIEAEGRTVADAEPQPTDNVVPLPKVANGR